MNNIPTTGNVQQHPASIGAYINHGWKLCVIPPNSKGPLQQGWNLEENTLQHESHVPYGHGIGLCHGYSGTCAIDIDDWEQAVSWLSEHGINLSQLFLAKDSVQIHSGNPGHGKLIYKMPPGNILPSKRINVDNKTILEFRCATADGKTVQDVLPPSIHPGSNQPYQWAGYGNWQAIPQIPKQLFELWEQLNQVDQQRTIKTDTQFDASWDEIAQALGFISPEMSYPDWVKVGMALHDAGSQSNQLDQAYGLFDTWSQGSPTKYNPRTMHSIWRSFKEKDNKIGIATVFHFARENGYKRPVPSVEEIFKGVSGPTHTPEQILAMFKEPAPVPDINLFPAALKQRAEEVAQSVGCDPLVPLFSGLASIGGAADARTRLEIRSDWQVPPVLWVMTIAKPADKKSPGSEPMMQPLHKLEADAVQNWVEEHKQWQIKEKVYQKLNKEHIESEASSEAALPNEVRPNAPEYPPEPIKKRLVVSDVTSQELVRLSADRPEGMLCHLDEMASWMNKIADPRSVDFRSTWTQSYESKPLHIDRVGSGNTYCENFALSIYGNVQPAVLTKNIKHLTEDGLLQRFVPIVLDPDKSHKGNPVPAMFSCAGSWEQLVRNVHNKPQATYRLSPEAYQLFDQFHDWYYERQQLEQQLDTHDMYQTALGKVTGLCGRIALLFHLIETANQDDIQFQVPATTMQRVIDLVKDYIVPAYRHAWGNIGGIVDSSIQTWVRDYVIEKSGHRDKLTLSTIKKSARRQLDNVPKYERDQVIIDVMTDLEDINWVIRLEEQGYNREHVTWFINPYIKDMFKEQRKQKLIARQKLYDENVRIAAKSGRVVERRIVPGLEEFPELE